MNFRPLASMKVLDLSRALSGPFCAAILGDLGADVVKVEPAGSGDMIRTWGPFDQDQSVYYLSCNRNKRSIALDFRSAEGRKLLRRLVLGSDVLLENFKPGTLEKLGLDPDELRAEKPDLIIASISGFGSTGPLREHPGFDQIAQGYSGFMSFTGTSPTRVGVAIGDMTAGMWLAIGVLAAWCERQQSGKGRNVETSLLAGLVGLLSVQGQRYLSLGEVPGPTGNDHPVIAPYGVFRAADGELNIGAATQAMWLSLCDIIGRPDLKADERFIDNRRRAERREELRTIIEAELARGTRTEWVTRLVEAGIPAGPINSVRDALDSEQVRALGLVEELAHPTLGALKQISNPIVVPDHEAGWVRRRPPLFAEHTREVLAEFGLSDAEIRRLEADGAIVQGEQESAQESAA